MTGGWCVYGIVLPTLYLLLYIIYIIHLCLTEILVLGFTMIMDDPRPVTIAAHRGPFGRTGARIAGSAAGEAVNIVHVLLGVSHCQVWLPVIHIYIYIHIHPLVNQHNYGKSPFLMGKSTISMAMFNSFLYVYQRVYIHTNHKYSWIISKIRLSS